MSSVRIRSPRTPSKPSTGDGEAATIAYRRAWWALVLSPLFLAAAFAVGEGLYSWLSDGSEDPAFWVALVAATPAIVILAVPGVAAALFGRRAIRLGRPEGRTPAVIGAAVTIGLVGLNLLSYLAQRIAG